MIIDQLFTHKKLYEFAPSDNDSNGSDPEEMLRRMASHWWNGNERQMAKVENTLAAMGWEIGQDDGYDDGGVFVVRAGDEHGRSYISWPHADLELNEGRKKKNKKTSRSLGRYFFPGFGYYGGGESGEGGGDGGGGESANPGMAEAADPSRRGFLKKAAGAAAAGAAMSAVGPEIVTLVKGFAEQAGGLNGIQALKAMLKIATPAELYNMYDYYADSGIMEDAITESDMIALDRAGYNNWSEFEEHCDENGVDPDDEFKRLTGQPLKVSRVDDILGQVDDTWSLEDFFDQYPEAMNIINPPRESLLSMRQLANIDTAAKGASLPAPIVAMANAVAGLVRQIFKSNGQQLAAPQQVAQTGRAAPALPAPTRPEFDMTPDLKQKEKVPMQRKGDDEEPADPRKTIQLLVDVGALSRGVLTDKSGMITKEKAQELLNKYYDGNQDMAEGEYDSRKPFGVRYKVFAGREGRMTTREYWTSSEEKLQRAVDKIQALDNFYEIDGYSYPKESQGVAEGSEQKPAITYKDYTLQYDYQTEDDDPEGYSTATTYYFDVLKDGDRVGEAEYFDYFGNLTIRINGKTKEFGFRHPLASQISQLVSSLPDEQKKDLSDPRFESQGLTEVFADQGSGSTDRDNADYMKRRRAAKKAGYTSRETKAGTWRVFKDGNAVAVAGPFKSADEAAAWIKKHKQGITEMDKSEPSAGRDGSPRPGPDKEAKPISAKKATRDAGRMLNRAFQDSRKKKDVNEAEPTKKSGVFLPLDGSPNELKPNIYARYHGEKVYVDDVWHYIGDRGPMARIQNKMGFSGLAVPASELTTLNGERFHKVPPKTSTPAQLARDIENRRVFDRVSAEIDSLNKRGAATAPAAAAPAAAAPAAAAPVAAPAAASSSITAPAKSAIDTLNNVRKNIGKGSEDTNVFPPVGTNFQNKQYIKDLEAELAKTPNDPIIKAELKKMIGRVNRGGRDPLWKKLQEALIKEGRVKELADDLKTLNDAEFMKKYGKNKAAIRRDMKRIDEKLSTSDTLSRPAAGASSSGKAIDDPDIMGSLKSASTPKFDRFSKTDSEPKIDFRAGLVGGEPEVEAEPRLIVDPLPDMQKWGGKFATGSAGGDNRFSAPAGWRYVEKDEDPARYGSDITISGTGTPDWRSIATSNKSAPPALDLSPKSKFKFDRAAQSQVPVDGSGANPNIDNATRDRARAYAARQNAPADAAKKVDWRTIYALNKATIGSNPNIIKPRMQLNMPNGTIYLVQPGDTLTKIAAKQNQVNELSTEKLAQYKTAAARDARAADQEGDVKRGDKRFGGIVKATKKQFDNDAKKVDESRAARRALMARIVNSG